MLAPCSMPHAMAAAHSYAMPAPPRRPCNPVLMLYNRPPLAHIRLRRQNTKAVSHGTQHTHSHMTQEDAAREDANRRHHPSPRTTQQAGCRQALIKNSGVSCCGVKQAACEEKITASSAQPKKRTQTV